MNLILKTAFTLLLSSQAFAVNIIDQAQMNENIQKLKVEVATECSVGQGQSTLEVSKRCSKKSEDYLKTNFCNRKKDLVLFFEGVMSRTNVVDVSKRFGGVPPADALGGVLLYQMRSSLDQVNETWSHQLKRVSSACGAHELKRQLSDYTNIIREDLKQTTLFVNPPTM